MRIFSFLGPFAFDGCFWWGLAGRLPANEDYTYKPSEYVTVVHGRPPDRAYAVAAHGDDPLSYEHFHLYLMDGKTGKKIGPLEEAKDLVDTGAGAYTAKWSADSREVAISYRQDRHQGVTIRYRIDKGCAFLLSGPTEDRQAEVRPTPQPSDGPSLNGLHGQTMIYQLNSSFLRSLRASRRALLCLFSCAVGIVPTVQAAVREACALRPEPADDVS